MDVTKYRRGVLNVGRGCTEGHHRGEDQEQQCEVVLRNRWFRMRIRLGGRDNAVTCRAVGRIQRRQPEPDQDAGWCGGPGR